MYSLLVIYLGPNSGGGNEDNCNLLPKIPKYMHWYTQCQYTSCQYASWYTQPCCRTLPTQAFAGDSGHSRASLGQSLVGSLLLSPGSWFCLCPPKFCQSCGSSDSSMVGLMATSSKRAYGIPRSAAPEPLRQSTADLYPHRRCSNTVLSQCLWGLWVLVRAKFV